ncbi:pirin family protein [Haliangium ochraceum]|uniref:Pirin domain protein n=1 Tax=Haliangium ochraceum (strain DSM 14365 / JCM 11303 / SMP-2) TaxID=502025 RepID=D0LSA2_HALO1|nr:pirin family protein [Haliangium ochraceum]ACY15601.1 Pirin domain protein [Haliangium ochraceum DSM 14365]
MMNIRRSDERGVGDHGWLHSRHTFSFANYYDQRFTGYRDLLVINEDQVAPGRGFGTHGHRDMEILSYVLSGGLQHADSLGNGSVIVPGEVQRMSAGTGVRHSEYNDSKHQPVHFLQIWIRPREQGLAPSYEQKSFSEEAKRGRLCLVASEDGREGSLTIHQDVAVYASLLDAGSEVSYAPQPGRHLWLQVAGGALEVGGETLAAGDALASDAGELRIRGALDAEFLLFDLA